MKKRIWKIFMPIMFLAVYLILDFIDFASLIKIPVDTINVDILGILVNATIVIVLYVISFYYIDNKQNEKDENARNVVKTLIGTTYKECINYLTLVRDRNVVKNFIAPKVDGNKAPSEDKVINNFQTIPFSSFDKIMDMAASGYVCKKDLDDYLEIKKEYKYLVANRIIFYDLVVPQNAEQAAMIKEMNEKDTYIVNKIGEFLEKN